MACEQVSFGAKFNPVRVFFIMILIFKVIFYWKYIKIYFLFLILTHKNVIKT
jgi:hypothetical protein